MSRNGLVWAGVAAVTGVTTVLLPPVAAALGAFFLLVLAAAWLKLWRFTVAVSFVASVARSGAAGAVLPDAIWYVAQFGPLAITMVFLLTRKRTPLRVVDRGVLVCLGLYAACALLTAITGLFPTQTLAQSGLLIFMFGFLALTVSRRWATSAVIHGDMVLGVALICVAQLVGLAAMVAGQVWATADYGRFQGVFSNANYAGTLSAIGIMLGFYIIGTMTSVRWWLTIVGMLVLGSTLILSGSRGALLALAIGVMSLFIVRASRRLLVRSAITGVVLATIAVIASPTLLPSLGDFFDRTLQGSDITSGRLQIYGDLLARWSQMPWLGTGYRTTELLSGAVRLTGHSTYLAVLAETGVLGAAVFAVLLFLIVRAGPHFGPDRVLLGAVITVLSVELTESILFGWGSTNTMLEWLTLLAFAAAGRMESANVISEGSLEKETPTRFHSAAA